jgi:hypothetical protein
MYAISKFKSSFVAAAMIAALGIHVFPAQAQKDALETRMERVKATVVKVETELPKTETFIGKQAEAINKAVLALQRGKLTATEFLRVLSHVAEDLQIADRELTSHESQANFAVIEIESIRRSRRSAALSDEVLDHWMTRANKVLDRVADGHNTIDRLLDRIVRLAATLTNDGAVPAPPLG